MTRYISCSLRREELRDELYAHMAKQSLDGAPRLDKIVVLRVMYLASKAFQPSEDMAKVKATYSLFAAMLLCDHD